MSKDTVALLEQMLEGQKKQTVLLEQIAMQNLALIEALADGDGPDPDVPPRTYMDGSPCR